MGKLVDADELYAAFRRDPMGGLNYDRILREAKPVDAVQVVRCGKCNFWDIDHISCEGLAKCLTGESGIRYRKRNDYCSRGEQDDDAND